MPQVWNVYELLIRTNKFSEGWHSKLEKEIKIKPDIYSFIQYLKREEAMNTKKCT